MGIWDYSGMCCWIEYSQLKIFLNVIKFNKGNKMTLPEIIFECLPNRKFWVILPTVIFFEQDENNDIDLTFGWLCFGITLRWNK